MINEELSKIQHTLKCNKGQFNNFGNYKYRSCEDIYEAAKPIITLYGCSLVVTDEVQLIGERYYVKATATLYNSKGESITATAYARETAEKKGMDASQITGATSSYARKYALNGLFCLDDTKDADDPKSPLSNKPQEKETTPSSMNTKMTQEQFITINGLEQSLKDYTKKKFNVQSLAELTFQQAEYIINALKEKGQL